MSTKIQGLRSNTAGARPADSTQSVGVQYTNFADGQFGVIDAAQKHQDLIAVRYFRATAVYSASDMVVEAGVVYKAKADITTPGVFDATEWDVASNIKQDLASVTGEGNITEDDIIIGTAAGKNVTLTDGNTLGAPGITMRANSKEATILFDEAKNNISVNHSIRGGAVYTINDSKDFVQKKHVNDALGTLAGNKENNLTYGTVGQVMATNTTLDGYVWVNQNTYTVGDGGLTEKNFTAADKTKLDASLTAVDHDATLTGSGTSADPLKVVASGSTSLWSADTTDRLYPTAEYKRTDIGVQSGADLGGKFNVEAVIQISSTDMEVAGSDVTAANGTYTQVGATQVWNNGSYDIRMEGEWNWIVTTQNTAGWGGAIAHKQSDLSVPNGSYNGDNGHSDLTVANGSGSVYTDAIATKGSIFASDTIKSGKKLLVHGDVSYGRTDDGGIFIGGTADAGKDKFVINDGQDEYLSISSEGAINAPKSSIADIDLDDNNLTTKEYVLSKVSEDFTDLGDTPSGYTGNEGKRVTVNSDGTGLIFTEESGLGIASAKYKFNSSTTGGDPTDGHASLNNSDPALATEMYISKKDISGSDKSYGLGLITKGDFISLADRNSSDHHNFKLSEKGVDSGTYITYSNVVSTSSIGAHNNNENIYVEAYMTGAKNFTGLLDTPDTYTGSAGMVPVVNAAETALELVSIPSSSMWEDGNTTNFIKPSNSKLIEVNTANDFGGVINAAPLAPDVSGGIQVSDVGGTKTGANGHYTFVSVDLYKHDTNDFYVLRLVEPNMWVVSEDSNTSAPAHDMAKVISYKFTSPENGFGHYYGFNGNTHASVGDTNNRKFFNAISTTGTIYSDTDIKANERFIVGHGAVFEHNADGGVNIVGVPNTGGIPFSVFSANTEIFRITSTGTVLAPGSTVSGLTQKKELVTKEYVDTMVMTKAMTIAEPQAGDHFTMWITDNPIIVEKVMAISSNGDTTFNITGSVTGDIFSTAQTCNTTPVVHSPDQNTTIGALSTINVTVNSTTVSNGHFNVTVHYRYVG